MNVTFEYPQFLYVLLLLPVLYWLLNVWRNRRIRTGHVYFDKVALGTIAHNTRDQMSMRNILLLGGLMLGIIAAANPRIPGVKEIVKQQSADIVIALDVSKSMLAKDVAPDRMSRSRKFLSTLVDRLKGERIAFIVFAGTAYVSMPLTDDYSAAKEFINGASTDMVSLQGTALGDAMRLAVKTFSKEEFRSRGMIIVSDGEDHDSDALAAAAEAAKAGIIISSVGIGSDRGALIPEVNEDGTLFKLDETGTPIRTKLNEALLAEIAEIGGGSYYNMAAEQKALSGLETFAGKLSKGDYRLQETTNYYSLAGFLMIPACVLLFIELLIAQGFWGTKRNAL